jgi:hypothetical protein
LASTLCGNHHINDLSLEKLKSLSAQKQINESPAHLFLPGADTRFVEIKTSLSCIFLTQFFVVAGVLKGTKESVAKTRMFTTGVAVRIRKGCGLSTANLVIPHHFTARRG